MDTATIAIYCRWFIATVRLYATIPFHTKRFNTVETFSVESMVWTALQHGLDCPSAWSGLPQGWPSQEGSIITSLMPTHPATSRPTSPVKPLPTVLHPPRKASTAPLQNSVPPSHHTCAPLRVFFTASTQRTKSGWPVALPASGRSHSPSSWHGFAYEHSSDFPLCGPSPPRHSSPYLLSQSAGQGSNRCWLWTLPLLLPRTVYSL